jgi:hypothetical protein
MPSAPNDMAGDKFGPDKSVKTNVEVYDAEHGEYECHAGINYISSPKPAKDTKSPFGGLHGGK